MPYADKERQRAYQREWVRHKRQGSTNEQAVEPDAVEPVPSGQVWPLTKQHQIEGFHKHAFPRGGGRGGTPKAGSRYYRNRDGCGF